MHYTLLPSEKRTTESQISPLLDFAQLLNLNIQLPRTLVLFYRLIKLKGKKSPFVLFVLTVLLTKKNLHVMLADDDSDDREIFDIAMKGLSPDMTVSIAENGKKLMQHLNNHNAPLPDIIFLDLNMPLKNGVECLEEIRADERLRNIPIVIYTTSGNPEFIEDTYNKGADFYLCKPESLVLLKSIFKQLFALDWQAHKRPDRGNFVLSANAFK